MTLTRRQTLAILGGGTVIAAGAGAIDLTAPPKDALAPWKMAGQYGDPRKNALSYAILSPNPHNRQPWMVDLSVPDQATLYVDTSRLLPHTDPYSRQITIGLGCFLETLRMAAAEQGLHAEAELFPEGEDSEKLDERPVATLRFTKGAEPDPLFQHVMSRRTQKEAYDTARPVTSEVLSALESSGANGAKMGSTNDPDQVAALRAISEQAFQIEFETPRTYKESVDLFRIGRAEINKNPDGLDFSGPMFQFLHRAGMFTREGSISPDSLSYTSGLDMVKANVNTAMAHIWLVTEGNSRIDQIRTGQDWMRLNLTTTALGLGIQPLSQALQEFPEMAGPYAQIHKRLAPQGGTVQMWARLGYCDPVPESPRWPLDAKLI